MCLFCFTDSPVSQLIFMFIIYHFIIFVNRFEALNFLKIKFCMFAQHIGNFFVHFDYAFFTFFSYLVSVAKHIIWLYQYLSKNNSHIIIFIWFWHLNFTILIYNYIQIIINAFCNLLYAFYALMTDFLKNLLNFYHSLTISPIFFEII